MEIRLEELEKTTYTLWFDFKLDEDISVSIGGLKKKHFKKLMNLIEKELEIKKSKKKKKRIVRKKLLKKLLG